MILVRKGRNWQSYRLRFTNADILQWDTIGFFQLVPAALFGYAWAIQDLAIQSHIEAVYTNIDAAAQGIMFGDFDFWGNVVENEPLSGINDMTFLLNQSAPGTVINCCHPGKQDKWVDQNLNPATAEKSGNGFFNLADLESLSGIFWTFTNGGSGDLTGGSPANYIDFWLMLDMIPVN